MRNLLLVLIGRSSYLPIWFQAIKGVSAVQSGIDTIPLVLALVVGAIGAGQLTGLLGYYTPFMIASACVMPIGAGLVSTFKVSTGEPTWIGYQVLFGIGLGMGMQQGGLAAQTVLSKKDVPTGVALIFFCQMLGGAIFVSVGQNVFDSHLVAELVKLVPGLSPLEIVNTGATDIRGIVPAQYLHEVLVVYNLALREVFIVALAMGCISILGAGLVEFRSVKGKQGPTAKSVEKEESADPSGTKA